MAPWKIWGLDDVAGTAIPLPLVVLMPVVRFCNRQWPLVKLQFDLDDRPTFGGLLNLSGCILCFTKNLTPIKHWGHGALCGHTEPSFAFSKSAWLFLASDLDVEVLWLAVGGFQIDPNLGLFLNCLRWKEISVL